MIRFSTLLASIFVGSGLITYGLSIRCYECASEPLPNEYDPCLYGDENFLVPKICTEPSVCAAYHYQSKESHGTRTSISRGCQALRFGSTCEDIFNDLRRTGSVLPGQHTCSTCSEDLCNSEPRVQQASSLIVVVITTLIIIFFNETC